MLPTDKLETLSGLLSPGIGDELARLASLVPADQAIVEIGSFRGKSTAYLAAGAREGGGAHVYAVDPWDLPGNPYGKHGFSAGEVRTVFEQQLRSVRLWSRVTPIQAFSTDAAADWAGPPVGLLFIDGDHTEAAVRGDVDAWTRHLAPVHTIAFDDFDTKRNPGVRAVVCTLSQYDLTVVANHLAVCTKG